MSPDPRPLTLDQARRILATQKAREILRMADRFPPVAITAMLDMIDQETERKVAP